MPEPSATRSAATASAAATVRALPVTTHKSDHARRRRAAKGVQMRRVQSRPCPRSSTRRRARRACRCRRTCVRAGRSSSPAARSRRCPPHRQRRRAARPRPLRARARRLARTRAARDRQRLAADPLGADLARRGVEWLPFLALVLVLVFWQKGLYAERERRGGVGQIVSALVVVAAARARVRRRHRLPLHDLRDLPDGARPLDRADRHAARELRRRHAATSSASTGLTRRAVLVGAGEQRRAICTHARPRARRRRLRVPRRDRAVAGRRRRSGARRAGRALARARRRTRSTS